MSGAALRIVICKHCGALVLYGETRDHTKTHRKRRPMSRSVKLDTEGLREAQARAQEPATPICEAERRNKQALYVLENEWGCGRIDVGALQRLLRGDEPDTCKETP